MEAQDSGSRGLNNLVEAYEASTVFEKVDLIDSIRKLTRANLTTLSSALPLVQQKVATSAMAFDLDELSYQFDHSLEQMELAKDEMARAQEHGREYRHYETLVTIWQKRREGYGSLIDALEIERELTEAACSNCVSMGEFTPATGTDDHGTDLCDDCATQVRKDDPSRFASELA